MIDLKKTEICGIPFLTRRDALYAFILIIIAISFHFAIVFEAQISLDEDSMLFFYPLRAMHGDSDIGFWNPYMFCGFPRDANPQAQLLYAPNLIFYFFPTHIGYAILLAGHIMLGALLMAFLLRGLKLSSEAALFGGLTFLLCTFWRCKITNLGLLEGISWLPGVLYFYLLGLETKKWTPYIASALLLAMTILAGVPHTVVYALIFLFFITIGYAVYRHQSFTGLLAALSGTTLLAVGLSVGMWLPALLYLPESGRNFLELSKALEGSVGWQDIWKVFFGGMSQPGISRCEPWEGTCYIGATALFFLPVGFLSMPKRLRIGLFFALLFSILCTLGADGMLYPLLYRFFPGWSTLNLPNRSLLIAALSLPVFSAFGLQAWINRETFSKQRLFILLFFSAILLSIVVFAGYSNPETWTALAHSALTQTFNPQSITDAQWALVSFSLWTALTCFAAIILVTKKSNKSLIIFLLLVLLIAQSALYSQRLFLQTGSPDLFMKPRNVRLAEKQTEPGYRVCSYVPMIDTGSDVRMPILRPAMMHRLPEVYRLPEIQGYDPLFPKRYGELIRQWADHSTATDKTRTIRLKTLPPRLLDLLSVSTVIGYPNQQVLYTGKGAELNEPGRLGSSAKKPETVESVMFRWLLTGAVNAPQGAIAARVNVNNASDTVQTFPVRVGQHISNYITIYPDHIAKHKEARIFRWFPVPSKAGYMSVNQYSAVFKLDKPSVVDSVSVDFLLPNCKLVIMEIDLLTNDHKGLQLTNATSELPVYKNPTAFPPVYMTRRLARYERLAEMISGFESLKPDEEIPVFFPEGEEIAFESSPVSIPRSEQTTVKYNRLNSDFIQLDVRSKYDGFLVITENYSPNWHATVDKQDVKTMRANHSFIAIPISAGEHAILLRYFPWNFMIAVSISGMIFCCLILILVIHPRYWLLPHNNS
jgi:membrane protein YfhO